MKNNIALTCLLLFGFLNAIAGSPTKKTIQIKIPAGVNKIIFFYRDASYKENPLILTNPNGKDTVVTTSASLSPGQILTRSESVLEDGKFVVVSQSYIVKDRDTIKLAIDSHKRLTTIDKDDFFIEDIIDIFFDFPDNYKPPYNAFLAADSGLELTKTIFKRNLAAVEDRYKGGVLTAKDYATLVNITKADYYFRLIKWGRTNKRFEEITDDVASLPNDLESIQQAGMYSVTQLFSMHMFYNQVIREIAPNDTRAMLQMILGLGWHKNITFSYICFALPDIKDDPAVLLQCYNDIKGYLNGEFPNELEKLRKQILPLIAHLDKVMLVDLAGKSSTLKQLLDKSPQSYFLIDFWASWCVPCREEAPLFEAAKKTYAGKNVVFVSLSTDEDNKSAEWKQALKDDGLLQATNQYRLVGSKSNVLFANFGVPSIPRYILINAKGEFIDPDFPRPSFPEFKTEISRIKDKNASK